MLVNCAENKTKMNYLDKEKEKEELQKLIEQDLIEEQDPDYQQYANLKWRKK